ncbi:MAG: methyl-accepting chemotaxis protein [Cyanobacteria bacterium J06606_4]
MKLLPDKKSPTGLLTHLYFSTIFVVSLLTVGGQILTQQSIARQQRDARIVNVAGRQRMLSQKVAKVANALGNASAGGAQTPGPVVDQRAAKAELREALTLFKKAHEGLQFGNVELDLSGQKSEKVAQMFADMEPTHAAIVSAADQLLETGLSDKTLLVRQIADNEDDFLLAMNAIVNQYEAEATGRVLRLKLIQQILLVLTLSALLPVLLPIHQITRQVNSMVKTMQQSGIQVKSSSLQIAASGKQLEATVEEQAAASSRITEFSQEIAFMAKSLNSHVQAVLEQAKRAHAVATDGEQELSEMATTLHQLEGMTAAISKRLGAISDRANTIDQVVVTITKVADQTNLLSLNAAIEAEKAGEYGAGFSVVAREIRRLADQTAISTLEIETLVKEMQAAVSVGVMEMDKFTQQVSDSTGRTQKVTGQVMTIAQQVQSFLPSLVQVSDGMISQSLNAGQIRDALEEFSLGSEQTVRSLQESNSALGLLQETAEGLQV